MPKVFIIGRFDAQVEKNYALAKELSASNETFILTLTESQKRHAELLEKLKDYSVNYMYVLRMGDVVDDKLSFAEEHAFIDKCLKAIQMEKPDKIYLGDDGIEYMNKNVLDKIKNHAKEVGSQLIT